MSIKPLSYKEQMSLAITEAQMENGSHRSIATKFGVSRTTLKAQLERKPTQANKSANQHLFILSQEQAILNFIDETTQFGFPAWLYMVKEKAALLIALWSENPPPIRLHWACCFVNYHSDLLSKFPHHLDQERH